MSPPVVQSPAKVVVQGNPSGLPGAQGNPGGNVLAIGLFTAAAALTIPGGTTLVQTSGYSVAGRGHAIYVEDTTLDDAAVAAHPRARFKSFNGRFFRLSHEQGFNGFMFGMVDDDAGLAGTDNFPAISAFNSYLKTIAVNDVAGWYKSSQDFCLPAGSFYCSDTIELTHTVVLTGAGPASASAATRLRFPAGKTGIRVQAYNTAGASSGAGATHYAGGASLITNLGLKGAYTVTEAEAHGIHLRNSAIIDRVNIDGFEGDGILASATFGSGTAEGNDNVARVWRTRLVGNRNGLKIDGDNANICSITSCDASSNRQWGFWDSSFLGNTFEACHSDSNGLVPGSAPSVVTASGFRYCVKVGQEVGASTNAPSGTTTDNTWWFYMGAGGTSPANNIAAWASGTTYRASGGYHTDDPSAQTVFLGCYHEGGQGLSQLLPPTLVIGGQLVGAVVRGVACLSGGTNLISSGGMTLATSIQANGADQFFGPGRGGDNTPLDATVYLDNTNAYSLLQARHLVSGAPTNIATAMAYYGFGWIFDVQNAGWAHRFRVNGTGIVNVDGGGVDIQAGKVLKVNGTQVLTSQQAAIADDASGAANQAKVNAILAAMRTHGLIA
jgi:hypothetical protein